DLFSKDEQEKAQAWNKLQSSANHVYKKLPGFFTPYRSIGEFGLFLAAPVVTPIVLGLVAGIATITAAVSGIIAIGSLLVAGGAKGVGLCNENAKNTANSALNLAMSAGVVAALGILVTVASAIITAVLLPLTIVALVTRSLASIATPIIDFFSSYNKSKEEQDFDPSVQLTN
ncbi:MAG: hypothetical protein HYX60_10370, partial [Legionella longbeachae]|nr:hypothetical protein [Legionella longbeachae]